MKTSWKGIKQEIRLVFRRGRQAWGIIPLRYKASLGIAAGVIAVVSACNTAMPLLLGRLVDGVREGADRNDPADVMYRQAALVLGLIALLYVAREGLNVVRRALVENTCARLSRDMILDVLGRVIRSDFGLLTKDKIGTLHGRVFRSVDGLVRLTKMGFLDFFPALFTGGFAIFAAVTRQPILGLLMAGVIPSAVFLTLRQVMSQRRVRVKLIRSCEQIDGTVVELLGGLEYVRAADTSGQELDRLSRATRHKMVVEYWHHLKMAFFGSAKALNEGVFHILVLGTAVYLAVNGHATYGDVLTFSILYLNVMAPLNEVHRILDEGHEASIRVGDLLHLRAQPVDPSFDVREPLQPALVPGEPVIEVEDLVVEYATPSGLKVRAVDGVSFALRHGETIGVAGFSGSGKTTWLKVLLRLLHPTAGAVRLGGVPLDRVDRAALGKLVGYVGQNPFVFHGTVAENIAYGTGDHTREEVEWAAKAACLHDEIMLMPRGYQAAVAERGASLSGGQRQRLAIARVLLKNPPILILDEATSALDNLNERLVQRALGLKAADRTTILVAHRLTTLRDADRILVFENGKVAEVGTYDELADRGGVFTRLLRSGEDGVDAVPALAGV